MSDEETKPETAPRSRQQDSAKRELETAPLMLRKASYILLAGALLPFFSGLMYAANAKHEVGDLTQAFDWKTLIIAKALVLLGGWVLYECVQVRAGTKPKSVLAGLAKVHSMAGLGVALLLWIGALVFVFLSPGVYVETTAGVTKEYFKFGAVAEVMTLMLALYSIAHIFEYEHGGKFNPMFPLLMIGPGLAGILNLLGSFSAFSNPSKMLGVIALAGGIIVAAGGGLAIYTMYMSFKEAKVQGELKKAAMREHRMAERAGKRKSNRS
ncbi:MAG: hypothetical protein H6829_03460 [Planctomycetes bacterium]|nr:hypothetical protein [Planctomycetota bacterium]HPF14114.1 hypothetical protein [Planctomycetota bacterium]